MGRERGKHPGATLPPRQDPSPPTATRTPSTHCPPANPRDPRPPRLQARASREGGEPKFTGHHLLSESVASLLPRAGLGGLEKRFSKSMPGRGTDSCPVDSHLRVRKEKIKYPVLRRCARMRRSSPSAHALFYPQRLRPNFMLVFADPFSQIVTIVCRLSP